MNKIFGKSDNPTRNDNTDILIDNFDELKKVMRSSTDIVKLWTG